MLCIFQKLRDHVGSSQEESLAGVLFGYYSGQTLNVVGCSACKDVSARNVIDEFKNVAAYIPGGTL